MRPKQAKAKMCEVSSWRASEQRSCPGLESVLIDPSPRSGAYGNVYGNQPSSLDMPDVNRKAFMSVSARSRPSRWPRLHQDGLLVHEAGNVYALDDPASAVRVVRARSRSTSLLAASTAPARGSASRSSKCSHRCELPCGRPLDGE